MGEVKKEQKMLDFKNVPHQCREARQFTDLNYKYCI